jgi:DDE superfamily endonuclease
MTGIQALERASPDKPLRSGSVAKQEFEYIRHGTTTLIGNFDVVRGEMFCETLGPTRTEADFVAHMEQTVASDPQVNWIFIVDNLNTHCSASLVEFVAKVCEPETELGQKGQHGILQSMESRREFLQSSEHRIRFVFLPKHSSWLNQIEIIFGIVMRKVIRRGNFLSVADLEEKLRRFIAYFNRVFAHPFCWTYTGKPLAPSPRLRFVPPHHRLPALAA